MNDKHTDPKDIWFITIFPYWVDNNYNRSVFLKCRYLKLDHFLCQTYDLRRLAVSYIGAITINLRKLPSTCNGQSDKQHFRHLSNEDCLACKIPRLNHPGKCKLAVSARDYFRYLISPPKYVETAEN
ncbi:hypothetical protein CEXT_414271 [Caerostris extrusa]|uniref:Uncharacterized protein n=1 Tax=Caerostris extrusa TaxID=172846 RepID=A0AAV4QKQ6_CAEEX|nr:hypothetical protein CEXT_414271 [Caerostris extrusa]